MDNTDLTDYLDPSAFNAVYWHNGRARKWSLWSYIRLWYWMR